MRRLLALLVLVVLFQAPAAAQNDTPPAVAQDVSNPTTALEAVLRGFVASGELSGAVTVIGTSQGPVDVRVLGHANLEQKLPMRRDTIFRIASMTKPITALAIVQLQEQGKLSVSDPVEKHLPEFQGQMLVSAKAEDGTLTLKKPARPITLADLLTHTSGLPFYGPGIATVYTRRQYTLSETTLAVSQMPLMFEPGTRWSYCNSGIDVLGRIVEVVSGQAFAEYLQDQIFRPLGMADTSCFPTAEQLERTAITYSKTKDGLVPQAGVLDYALGARHPVPAGGLYSTADDLSRLYGCLLKQGRHQDGLLLGAKSLAEMTSIHTARPGGGLIDDKSWGYGFSVVYQSTGPTEYLSPGSYGHGGAYGTQGWIDPVRGQFTILLIQRTGLDAGVAKSLHQALGKAAHSLASPAPASAPKP